MSTPRKENANKYKLGTKTSDGYVYSAKVNPSEDFGSQISQLMKEKKANTELGTRIKELKLLCQKFKPDRLAKNLEFYYTAGKLLTFIDDDLFKNFKPYSIFRRISEELPELLPGKNNKVKQKHLDMMYNMSFFNKKTIYKGSWDQWFEILKFKDLQKNPTLVERILNKTKHNTGPDFREELKIYIEQER